MAFDPFAEDTNSSGPFDPFAETSAPKKSKQNQGIAGDTLTGLKRGVEQIPGMLTGIAEIAAAPVSAATGINRPFSRAADWLGEKTGFQPGKWAEEAGQEYSPELQQSLRNVEEAKGFFPTLGAIAQNPRVAANLVAESLPSTIAGGILARGAMGAVAGAEKLAALRAAAGSADAAVANAAKAQLLKSGAIAGGIGEGAVTAGQQMAQTDYNVDPLLAGGTALAAGAITGAIGAGSGRLANSAIGKKLGLSDLETSIAAGTLGQNAGKAGALGYAKRIGAGAVQEGLLEEATQSYNEQVWQNIANGKPWNEGAAEAAAQGAVAGGLMGGGINAIPRATPLQDQAPTNPPVVPPTNPNVVDVPTATGSVPVDRTAGPMSAAVHAGAQSGAIQTTQPTELAQDPFERLATLELLSEQRDLTPQETAEANALSVQLDNESGAADRAAATAADVLGAQPAENNDTLNNQLDETSPVAPNVGTLDAAAAASNPIGAARASDQVPGATPSSAQAESDAKISAKNWDLANRTSRSQEWMAGAALSGPAFDSVSEEGSSVPAHGVAKAATLGQAIKDLVSMVRGGIDPSRTLYYDSLTNSRGGAGAGTGTAGGHAYRDGPFIITFREGLNGRQPTSADITGILVNPAHSELVAPLQSMFPNLAVRDYSGVADVVSASKAGADRIMQTRTDKQLTNLSAPGHSLSVRQAATAPAQQTTTSPLTQTATGSNIPQQAAKNIPTNPVANVQSEQANDAPKARSVPTSTGRRIGEVGMKLSAGEIVSTASGRETTPFPKFMAKSGRMISSKAVDVWLMQNALDEALSRGDEFNARQFEQNKAKPSQSDKDSAEEYLFGQQPDVPRSVLKPLNPNAAPQQEGGKQQSEGGKQQVEPKQKAAKKAGTGPQSRDDLVGAILGVTGGKGIHPKMAQTIVGDKANAATKVRGLFTLRGQEDLGDIAELLRVEENYDVRDGEHLAELVREQATGNAVHSMERVEKDASDNEVRKYREDIRKRASELGIKTAFVKFDKIETEVLAVELKQAQDEEQAEREAIQAANEVSDETINELLQLAAQENDGRYINEEWITDEQILDAFEPVGESQEEQAAAGAGEVVAGQEGGGRDERGEAPQFDLAAQTPAELKALADQKKAAEDLARKEQLAAIRAERAAKNKAEKDRRAAEIVREREAAKKAEVDALAQNFDLGQAAPAAVDRRVDTEQARGQQDVFAQNRNADIAPGLQAVAQRQVNAQNRFIESVVEQFGLTEKEAGRAWDYFVENKLLKVDAVGGQYTLTNGDFWDADAIRMAARKGGRNAEKPAEQKQERGEAVEQKPAQEPQSAEQKIRAAMESGDQTIGKIKPITIEHNGVTQNFIGFIGNPPSLANQRKGLKTPFTLSRIKAGKMIASLPTQLLVENYTLNGRNVLEQVGNARVATEGDIKQWRDAGFAVPEIKPAQEASQKEEAKPAAVDAKKEVEAKQVDASTLQSVNKSLDGLGIKHSIFENNGVITVSKIVVPEESRRGGIGTKAMQLLTDYADKTGQRIVLSPSADFGGNKTKLIGFYKRFGFVENKGRNKDFSTMESMYRDAKETDKGVALYSRASGETQDKYRGEPNETWTPDVALISASKKLFGTTVRPYEAGYVLPDGTMLDFTGRHETSKDNWPYMRDQRSVDHRMLFGENLDGFSIVDMLGSSDGNEAMHEFMARTGAMRVDFRSSVFSTMRPPSLSQLNVVSRSIGRDYAAASYVDGVTGRIIADTEWNNVGAAKIRDFFNSNKDKKPSANSPLFSVVGKDGNSQKPMPRQAAESVINRILGDKITKALIGAGLIRMVDSEAQIPGGGKLMTAYHGSPHDHEGFDSSKIGTGEGAQAYGWGHYFAGAKKVADWYRDKLAKSTETLYRGNLVERGSFLEANLRNLIAYKDFEKGKADTLEDMRWRLGRETGASADELAQAIAEIERAKRSDIEQRRGRLYTVDLKPSEDEYLLWDKPLSEQSDKVRDAIEMAGDLLHPNDANYDALDVFFKDASEYDRSGKRMYEALSDRGAVGLGDKAASEYLKSIGIRGIKYLDGSSRHLPGNTFSVGGATATAGHNKDSLNDLIGGLESIGFDNKTSVVAVQYLSDSRNTQDPLSDAVFGAERDYENGLIDKDIVDALKSINNEQPVQNYNYAIFDDADIEITRKESNAGQVLGATMPDGTIYLNLGALNEGNIEGVFKHEGFHASARSWLGEETYSALMKRLEQLRNVAQSKMAQGRALSAWYEKAAAAIPQDTREQDKPEELAGYAIEMHANGTEQPSVIRKWVEDFLSALRTAIIKHMPNGKVKLWALNNLKPQDLARMAVAGMKAKAQGQLQAQAREAMAYSQSLPTTINVDGTDRPTTNSNGKPIHPTEEGIRNFWKWFGDSKVVDADGKPLVVYHGTNADFSVFKTTRMGEFGPAIYLTDNPREAGEYGEAVKGISFAPPSANIMPVYARIENPYTKGVDAFWKEFGRSDSDAAGVERAKAAGYDGIIAKRADRYYDNVAHEFVDLGNTLTHYIAFSNTQVKSAIGNNGDFGANPDIRYSRASNNATPPATINVDGIDRPTTNSNGKPIHPTEEGIRNFWKWFAGSKVVDAQGRPLVVYHSSLEDIERFNKTGQFMGHTGTSGISVTDNPEMANRYLDRYGTTRYDGKLFDKNMMVLYVKAENPLYRDEPFQTNLRLGAPLPSGYVSPAVRLGYDSLIRSDAISRKGIVKHSDAKNAVKGREIMVFSPEQIKSAIGNNGQFDPTNPDIRYSRSGNAPAQPANQPQPSGPWQQAKAKFNSLVSPEAIDTLIYNFQDKYVDLKNVIDRIKQMSGTITDLNDARLGEETYHSKAMKKTKDFTNNEIRPLLQQLLNSGIKKEDFEQYLHARHAPEANAVLAERNPNQQMIVAGQQKASADLKSLQSQLSAAQASGSATKSIEDAIKQANAELSRWSGAQAFQGTEAERNSLSGMSDQKAAQILSAVPAGKLAAMQSAAAKVDAIQAKTLVELEKMGLMDKASLDAWRTTYQNYVPLHRDEAHPDGASHPVGQGFSVKGDASKRRVGSNEKVTNILGHIAMQREAAIVRGEKNSVSKRMYLLAKQNPIRDFWQVDRPPMIETIDSRTGFVRRQVDPNYKNKPNVLMVRIAGKDAAIVFNEHNPEAVRLAGALKNLDGQDLDVVERTIGSATRWIASVNTQYNPIFGLINFARDVQTGVLNLTSTDLKDKKAAVWKETMRLFKEITKAGFNLDNLNATDKALWNDFQDNGGATGYRDMFANPEDRAKALEKELNALGRSNSVKRVFAVADWLSNYNESMENVVRMSAYKVGLQSGMSKERAASLAKNLTVNFNRKGSKAQKLGAFYAFFNASVQGTARMAQTLKGPVGKKIIIGGIALGVMQQMLGMLFMGGGDDDEWDKIPDFVKERSMIFPTGKDTYVSIPMPLGFNVLPNIGRLMTEWAVGGQDKPTAKQIGKLFNIMLSSLNPVGGNDLVDVMSPTVSDPVVSLLRNKDWTGKPIYREDMAGLDPTPGFTRTKDTATPWAKGMSYVVNMATGGTNYQPGAVSWTPDMIDYVIGQLTGGAGREIGKFAQTISAPFSGDELPMHKVPLVGRVVGSTAGVSGQSERFYENIKTLNGIEREIKGLAKTGEDVDSYIAGEPKSLLVGLANASESQVKKLREAQRTLKKEGDTAGAKELDVAVAGIMKGLNAEVRAANR